MDYADIVNYLCIKFCGYHKNVYVQKQLFDVHQLSHCVFIKLSLFRLQKNVFFQGFVDFSI